MVVVLQVVPQCRLCCQSLQHLRENCFPFSRVRWEMMEEEFPQYQTSLTNVYGCSQNQSQGIELDVNKEYVCDEAKGMDLAEMIMVDDCVERMPWKEVV